MPGMVRRGEWAKEWPGDADALVLTGESSTPDWAAFAELGEQYIPASQDPRLRHRGLDDGYVSLPPGGHGGGDCSSSRALLNGERAHYPADTPLEALVVPDTGHALNLHRTAVEWFPAVSGWIGRES